MSLPSDDDDDFNPGAFGPSRLGSLFGQTSNAKSAKDDVMTGTEIRDEKPPPPPTPSTPAPTTPSPPTTTETLAAIVVHAFQTVQGQSVPRGKLAMALVGSRSKNVYQIILYTNPQNIMCAAPLTPTLNWMGLPNCYVRFFDLKGTQWLVYFDTYKVCLSFSLAVAVAMHAACPPSGQAPTVIELVAGRQEERPPGQVLKCTYQIWKVEEDKVGQSVKSGTCIDQGNQDTSLGRILAGLQPGAQRLIVCEKNAISFLGDASAPVNSDTVAVFLAATNFESPTQIPEIETPSTKLQTPDTAITPGETNPQPKPVASTGSETGEISTQTPSLPSGTAPKTPTNSVFTFSPSPLTQKPGPSPVPRPRPNSMGGLSKSTARKPPLANMESSDVSDLVQRLGRLQLRMDGLATTAEKEKAMLVDVQPMDPTLLMARLQGLFDNRQSMVTRLHELAETEQHLTARVRELQDTHTRLQQQIHEMTHRRLSALSDAMASGSISERDLEDMEAANQKAANEIRSLEQRLLALHEEEARTNQIVNTMAQDESADASEREGDVTLEQTEVIEAAEREGREEGRRRAEARAIKQVLAQAYGTLEDKIEPEGQYAGNQAIRLVAAALKNAVLETLRQQQLQ